MKISELMEESRPSIEISEDMCDYISDYKIGETVKLEAEGKIVAMREDDGGLSMRIEVSEVEVVSSNGKEEKENTGKKKYGMKKVTELPTVFLKKT